MPRVLYERDGRIGRITLNRPEVTWKQAVRERDEGTFDWTANQPFDEGS